MRLYTICQDEIGDGEAPSVEVCISLKDCKESLSAAADDEHDGEPKSGCLALWQPELPFGPQDPPDMADVTCLNCRIEEWDGEGTFWLYNPDRIGRGDIRIVAEAHDVELKL